MISLDTHWDCATDRLRRPPIRASRARASWKKKLYEFHKNVTVPNLVEAGERGMLEDKTYVRSS